MHKTFQKQYGPKNPYEILLERLGRRTRERWLWGVMSEGDYSSTMFFPTPTAKSA
jgi:hypothetical protein